MKVKNIVITMFTLIMFFLAPTTLMAAEEIEVSLTGADTMGVTLEKLSGKRVSLNLESGMDLTGTVKKVSQHLVHISKLTGKDFYDSIVRIDSINAITVRVRNK